MRAAPIAALLATTTVGCYSHTRVDPGEVVPGMSVRAYVNATAGDRIAPLLGGTDARRLTGTVIRNDNDTLIVEVPAVTREENGGAIVTLHQRVTILRGEVLELEARHLDRVRTGALVGAGALVAGTALLDALETRGGKEPLPGGGGGQDALVPVLQVLRGKGP